MAIFAVQLSPLCVSKGLGVKHVFLIGVEEGVLPHRESLDPAKLEEERRLMYAGITRNARCTSATANAANRGRTHSLRAVALH